MCPLRLLLPVTVVILCKDQWVLLERLGSCHVHIVLDQGSDALTIREDAGSLQDKVFELLSLSDWPTPRSGSASKRRLLRGLEQSTGTNIMLKKPSIQSGKLVGNSVSRIPSTKANDGSTGNRMVTAHGPNPYWQGDLLGFYQISTVKVTASRYYGWANGLRKAYIGVTVADVSCSNGVVVKCGQWPNAFKPGKTLSYTCPLAGPVRFVRIWRELYGQLDIAEVKVEGKLMKLSGSMFENVAANKVALPTMYLSVPNVTDCSRKCHENQPCMAFSYSTSEQANCLLATNDAVTPGESWVSYTVRRCFELPASFHN